jgi:CRISPR-associated endonuclease/helicase Cas3
MYIAHKREDGEEQSVYDHLMNVAEKAAAFADEFHFDGFDCSRYAFTMGLVHDLGKYSDAFQKKINQNRSFFVDHSTAGAKELYRMKMSMGAFAVAGHHGGLPDGLSDSDKCFYCRVKERELEDYDGYRQEIEPERQRQPGMEKFSGSFLTRMLFSCLVDADFLDTENFMQKGEVDRGGYDTIDILKKRLDSYIAGWLAADTGKDSINYKRTEILKQCIQAGKEPPGIYSLTVPTGAGKTISSLAFALEHAQKHNMKRIIYVIPYTSIIEQNAAVFRNIIGSRNVVEHHANTLFNENEENDDCLKRHQLSTENWDAPVIVTTNVQFFESLYSNKVSVCRKLHNIADSVIIFDEAQMIPLNYLKPCIQAVKELAVHYGVTAVMCTATQPALNRWFLPLQMKEICTDYKSMFAAFKRTNIKSLGMISDELLTEYIKKNEQVLVIVNKKDTAQRLYKGIKQEGIFHLSTNMTPTHRTRTLRAIRERLAQKRKCQVISTSLVEAGVDVDFPCVFREEAGLDSIIQAAGRCNREGKRAESDSIVWVFSLEEKPFSIIEKNISMMTEAVEKYESYDATEAMHYYFEQLQNLDEEFLDQKRIVEAFVSDKDGIQIPFEAVAQEFHLIENNTTMVIIPLEPEAVELLKELEYKKSENLNYKMTIRKLGMYSVNVFSNQTDEMIKNGVYYEILPGIMVLQRLDLYDEDMGLMKWGQEGAMII